MHPRSPSKKGKGCPCSIAERRVPELIPVLGSQPAGDVSHKPGGTIVFLIRIDIDVVGKRICCWILDFNTGFCAFSGLMLLVGWQEGHPACKKTEW